MNQKSNNIGIIVLGTGSVLKFAQAEFACNPVIAKPIDPKNTFTGTIELNPEESAEMMKIIEDLDPPKFGLSPESVKELAEAFARQPDFQQLGKTVEEAKEALSKLCMSADFAKDGKSVEVRSVIPPRYLKKRTY